ncbi:hypothetical protein [Janthinobacterium sp. FW305-128]|uniref:hypothetical protein n=1 Tax=Janthinobacterium sp. FW305-128 TaxID=2775055 RepID=UPI001E310069|nr:hypothetical protein [Janthinobacterium sp. FW305-128]MCC7684831.1 hypothetical protein [Janthinobacterium sp. FW305-128]
MPIYTFEAIPNKFKKENKNRTKNLMPPTAQHEKFSGKCNRCGDQTEASKPSVVACKWGGCNGVVHIT